MHIPIRYQLTKKFRNENADNLSKNFDHVKHDEVYGKFYEIVEQEKIDLSSILDFGAGNGRDAVEWIGRGYSVMAMEPAEKLLQSAIIERAACLKRDDDEFDKENDDVSPLTYSFIGDDEYLAVRKNKKSGKIVQWFDSVSDTPGSFYAIHHHTRLMKSLGLLPKSEKDDANSVHNAYTAFVCNAFFHYPAKSKNQYVPSDRKIIGEHAVNIVEPGGVLFVKGRDTPIKGAEHYTDGTSLDEMKECFEVGVRTKLLHEDTESNFSKKMNSRHKYPMIILQKL